MGTVLLRSEDPLKGRLHLEAFGSRPPPPRKPYRKKSPGPSSPSSSSPLSSPPASSPSTAAAAKPSRRNQPARSSPPPHGKPPRRQPKSPSPGKGSSASDEEIQPMPRRAPLVMEEIRILKRGEELKPSTGGQRSAPDCSDSAVLCSTKRIGPEPGILPKKMGFADLGSIYAGPAFSSSSPSPSSLPIPGFFLKKANLGAFKGDEATRALRSVLRLDVLL